MSRTFSRWTLALGVALLGGLTACDPGADPTASAQDRSAASALAQAPGGQPASYIVVLERGQPDVPGLARALAAQHGAAPERVFTRVLEGFSARLPAQAAEALARNPLVDYVELDGTATIVGSGSLSPATWGIDRIDQRALPLNNTYGWTQDGTGVHAYILDTGIRTTHVDFGGRAVFGADFVSPSTPVFDDCHGHGTHVAGTVGGTTWGVAKNATLYGVRVLGCNGSGTYSGIIDAIDWVAQQQNANGNRPTVINMSLGGGFSGAVNDAVDGAVADGVVVAVAAGNSNADACTASPASAPTALTVGSTTSSDTRSSFSNFGSCVDLFAPGSGITSATYTSDTSTGSKSGTSMASPHVAGVAALILSGDPTLLPSQVEAVMLGNATTGALSGIGSGSPNLLLYSGDGGSPPPPPPPPPSETTVHVGGLSVSVDFGKRNANGTALVTVMDDAGAPVASATVVGDWKVDGSVAKSGTSGVSGSDGTAAIGSGGMRGVRSSDVVEFCVTGISGTGLVYDRAANAATCAVAGNGGGGDPPPPAGFAVTVSVRKNAEVTLSWSGGTGPYVITRNGGPLASDLTGTSYLDVPGPGDFSYRVCDSAAQCGTVSVSTKR